MREKFGLLVVLGLGWIVGGVMAEAAAPEGGERVLAALGRLEAELGAEAGAEVLAVLGELRALVGELVEEVEGARFLAAGAQARLASHTGAYLSRELGKLGPSQRLVEMTRATGRSSEVVRYENRHRMLEEAIAQVVREYEEMIRELCGMPDALVQRGFADYEARLIDWGMAEQIRIHQKVKGQYEAYREKGEADLETWKKELGSL